MQGVTVHSVSLDQSMTYRVIPPATPTSHKLPAVYLVQHSSGIMTTIASVAINCLLYIMVAYVLHRAVRTVAGR